MKEHGNIGVRWRNTKRNAARVVFVPEQETYMNKARITPQKEPPSSGRKWLVSAFAAAIAGSAILLHFTDGSKAGKPAVQDSEMQSVFNKSAEARQDLPTPQLPHEQPKLDMWQMLQLAENTANQQEAKYLLEDIAYSKTLSEETCKAFWFAHRNFQLMQDENDPIRKADYFRMMPIQYARYMARRSFGSDVDYQQDLYKPIMGAAIAEMEGALRTNPQDAALRAKYINAVYHLQKANGHLAWQADADREENLKGLQPQLFSQAYDAITKPPPADLASLEGDAYTDFAWQVDQLNLTQNQDLRLQMGITDQSMASFNQWYQQLQDEEIRQHRDAVQKYKVEHGAGDACPGP
jgi:hypothetical protein